MTLEDVRSVRRFYDHLRDGSLDAASTLLHTDITWSADEGCPSTGTLEGVEQVRNDVLLPLVRDWGPMTMDPFVFLEREDDVVVVGHMHGKNLDDGRTISARFADVWTLRSGRLARCERTTDPTLVAKLARGRPLLL